jgi:hypothetical protein
VQVDVRQKRGDHPALWCPRDRLGDHPVRVEARRVVAAVKDVERTAEIKPEEERGSDPMD